MPENGSSCTSIINMRYQDGSEGSSSNPTKFNYQDYAQLKANSLRRGRLFVDGEFPPSSQSLGDIDLARWRLNKVEWLRPRDILNRQNIKDDPIFCKKGASRFDFGQGNIGNCWFLAAINSLTFNKSLMVQVVPMDQSFQSQDYAGIFHFRFWRYGKWVDVVIDDSLPFLDNKLLSVHTKGGNEFWVPLLEKAYAKVCGTYGDMNAGLPSEACKDFSGGVHMTYLLGKVHTPGHDVELWNQLSRATGCNSMICCGTAAKGDKIVNTVAHTGIVDAHAYSVTGTHQVRVAGQNVMLVRIMNPWGQTEWNGNWSDKSDMWKRVSPEDREKCVDRDDGEFWMELEDFCYYYNMVSICCENPNFLDGDLSCKWQCMVYDGIWAPGRSAGGNVNESTFATNPQYRIKVTKINKKEKDDQNILLSLMQKPQEKNRKEERYLPCALTLFQIPQGTPKGRLDSTFFRRNRPVKNTQNYSRERDLIESHSLELGEYVIVPSTMQAYTKGEFVLSVYSKADVQITPHERDDDDDDDHDDGHDHGDKEDELVLPEIPTETDKPEENTTDNSTRAIFNLYANQNGELNARQLQKLLNDKFPLGTWNGFGLDTCMSMCSIVDTDHKMTMTLSEFSTLWTKMEEFRKLFNRYDSNDGGSLSEAELGKAIEGAGIDTNDFMVQMMMFRYSGNSYTTLESFITLMLRLENTKTTFDDKSTDGVITFTWDEWSMNSMYN